MNHYFIHDKRDSLKHNLKHIDYSFAGRKFRFAAHPGIFSKDHVDYATNILLDAIPPIPEGSTLLDMGCGYGCIGIVLAKVYGLNLTQSDINPAAVDLTRLNCEYNEAKSSVIASDCFSSITGKFDVIVINPPIHAGKAVTYKMYAESVHHLNNHGKLYVVTLKKHGAESTLAKLQEIYDNCEVLYKKKGVYVFELTKST